MSTRSSSRRTQRAPPGSLEFCWAASPPVSAVQASKARALLIPHAATADRAIGQDGRGDRVGLFTRLEAGDRSLEQQLVADRVLDAEPHERAPVSPQGGYRVGCFDRLNAGQELEVRLGEHRVVHVVLGREVRVQRLGPHADGSAQITHGEGDQTLGPGQTPRCVEDLLSRRCESFRATIANLVD